MRGLDAVTMGRSFFDRAAEHRKDPAWIADAWTRARVLRVSSESTTPVYQDGALKRLRFAVPADVDAGAERWYLGLADDVPYFAVRAEPAPGDEWQGIRQLGLGADPLELDLLVTSVALTQWHQRHDHCPRCGALTTIEQAGWTRHCPVDGSEHFPRTDPAVIMLVHDGGDRCLLGRGAAWPPGRFSTLAGFVEPGESLEAAVIREVGEEVGVVVDDVRYVGSQPWPFPSSLMLGFTAYADPAAIVAPDRVEVLDAGWFTRAEVARAADWTDADSPGSTPGADAGRLLAIPPSLSISRHLIDGWLSGRLPR